MAGATGDTIYCPHCGKALPLNARFCAGCGQAIEPLSHDREKPKTRRPRWLLPVAAVAVLAIGAAIGWTILRGGSSQELVVGALDRDGTYDIHVVSPGEDLTQGNRALREIRLSNHVFIREAMTDDSPDPTIAALHRGNDWILAYADTGYDDYYVTAIKPGDTTDLYDGNEPFQKVAWNPTTETLEITIGVDGPPRCYESDGQGPSRSVGRGDSCYWQENGVFVTADWRDDQIEIEVELPDGPQYGLEVDDYAGAYAVSGDGRYTTVAVAESPTRSRLHVFDLTAGESVLESDRYTSATWAGQLDLNGPRTIALVGNDNGDRTLLILDPVALTVLEISDAWNADLIPGSTSGFATKYRDGDYTLARFDLSTSAIDDIIESDDWLDWSFLQDGSVLCLTGDGRASLIAASGEVTDLGRVDVDSNYPEGFYVRAIGDDVALVELASYNDDVYTDNLFVVDLDAETMTQLLSGWSFVGDSQVSPDRQYVVFSGGRDDWRDAALWRVPMEGTESPERLDHRADGYYDISISGSDIYYTAITGDDADNREIRRVHVTSGERPETLYENARLIVASWDEPTRWLKQAGPGE